jgi:hypothetical protein
MWKEAIGGAEVGTRLWWQGKVECEWDRCREVRGGIGKGDVIGGERVLELLRPPIFSFSLWKSWAECHMIYTIMLLRVNLNFCLILKKQSADPCVNI